MWNRAKSQTSFNFIESKPEAFRKNLLVENLKAFSFVRDRRQTTDFFVPKNTSN